MSECNCGDMPPGGRFEKGHEPPVGCPIHGQTELIATLRRGNCLHNNRVNICANCLARLEKLIA